ncbi:PREDICTED: U3 small nucleolar ribonucleoprotein protein MPP10 [Dinoponera quadriceps]|uniref:U3 small nucleolar ribonucleoprotein protein MPP10 n=1 Tax=Dinoponera quadriceps TaxID=609295 RepID=A0A6P3Y3U8_DINQU|nr:PREDICTED: U3 small nucleolar ribonucleoprotein protein MPP10 [Dinoponera quadriceps]
MANIFDSIISTLDNVGSLQSLQTKQNVLDLRDITKSLYDFTKKQSCRKSKALPELILGKFTEEPIWQQLELQNESELTHFSEEIPKVLADKNRLAIPVTSTKPELIQFESKVLSDDKEEEDENTKTKSILKKKKPDTKKKKSSIVDDKFFKLQELNEYLIKEERKEKHGRKDDESEDELVDMFHDFSEEGDVKYVDFFDSPALSEQSEEEGSDGEDGGMDDGEDEEEEYESSSKKVKFNLTNDSDETDSLENKVGQKEGKEEDKNMGPKSSLETRQERLRTKIQELEEETISEKPWQLKGEVSGLHRPQNSLLEEFVEFDVTTRPAPIITEETTMKLEDIIKQRIKDKAWDDVQKKFKPVETPLEYKKKVVMNQEKSKESLSQIYENEYLKQKQALNPDEEKEEVVPQLHHEIQREMRKLMLNLDALSNYHYTPRQIKPEIKIISNLPAVNMEEVAPVATSDAAMLAPEEIKAKLRGDPVGKSERTKTDKKRERRRKKLRQRAKQRAMEEKEKLRALKPGIAKKYKKENAALLKQLTKDRNITKSDETNQTVAKSSTAFFTQLQNQVKTKIGPTPKKKDKKTLSAVKLKL